jgi:hypothetical protein
MGGSPVLIFLAIIMPTFFKCNSFYNPFYSGTEKALVIAGDPEPITVPSFRYGLVCTLSKLILL